MNLENDPFRTNVNIKQSPCVIEYDSNLFFVGSCFADNIGSYFQENCFNALVNPYGVVYNPISVANVLSEAVNQKPYKASDLIHKDGLYHSFMHHSLFSGTDANRCIEEINKTQIKSHQSLLKADVLFITFGTAWVYEYIQSNEIVANCHKIPASHFKRYRLGIEDITMRYKELITQIRVVNPKVEIVFTVSPVRHLKDGAVENQLSKATLLLAINNICMLFDRVNYFPAYEILLDDLRDYRFFAEDMTHPSKLAIEYIRSKLIDSWLSKEAIAYCKQMEKIKHAKTHRPFNAESEAHQLFLNKQITGVNQLIKKYPNVDLSRYLDYFTSVTKSY